MKFGWIAAVAVAGLIAAHARADELVIRTPLGYAGVLAGMTASFEAATGDRITIAGNNDTADLVILGKEQVEAQVKAGKIDAAGITDLGQVRIGFAVKAGGPKPDISTPEKLKAAVLAAKSVGLSRYASGQFVLGELFPALGIADQVQDRIVRIDGSVGEGVVRGEAEVGFQQMGELLQVTGLTVVGRIPKSLERVIVYTAGLATGTKVTAAAQRFIAYAKSPAAAAAYKAMDFELVK